MTQFVHTKFSEFVAYLHGPNYLERTFLGGLLIPIRFDLNVPEFEGIGIAGGAIRDLLIGKEFKDIDTFRCNPNKMSIDDVVRKVLFRKYDIGKPLISRNNYAWSTEIRLHGKTFPVQFIDDEKCGKGAHEILKNFDFHINQFMLFGNDTLIYTRKAMSDLLARKLDLTDSQVFLNHEKERKIQRLDQLMSRGFTPTINTLDRLLK